MSRPRGSQNVFGTILLALEQYLHWQHCHRAPSDHRHLTYLILIADAVHNLIGGTAVAGAFLIDIKVGISAGRPKPLAPQARYSL